MLTLSYASYLSLHTSILLLKMETGELTLGSAAEDSMELRKTPVCVYLIKPMLHKSPIEQMICIVLLSPHIQSVV